MSSADMGITLKALNGETLLVGLLGDPVKQVRSPRGLTARMQALGMNAIQLPLHVTPADFVAFIAASKRVSNIVGHVLTVPHKIAGLGVVDQLTDTAKAAGSINLMRREKDGSWLGHNVDGIGLVKGLVADGSDPRGKTIFIAGAGGAGCGGAAALADAGARYLRIFDTSADRIADLANRIRLHYPKVKVEALDAPDPSSADIAVNATPLGMQPGDPFPLDISRLSPGAVVAEFVMKPSVTPLLAAARAAGHKVSLGENVMNYQQPYAAAFFLEATATC